jgi:predicted phage terminase large subunit-like protein
VTWLLAILIGALTMHADRVQSAQRQLAQVRLAQAVQYSRTSFDQFVRTTHHDYEPNWHHAVMAREIDAFVEGTTKNLMLFMPPRHGKSEQGSRRLPAYIFGRKPNAAVIATSYSADLAKLMNRDVQRIIDAPIYGRIFPQTQLWNRKRTDATLSKNQTWIRNSDLFEIVGHRGYYRCAGVGGGITGMGADYGLIDDPIKNAEEAASEVYREKVWEWYVSTFRTRLSKNGQQLLIMTRWHEDDLAGRLLQLAKSNANADQWRVVSFPAILETETAGDPRQVGEALWPAWYPREALERLRALSSYQFAALFQQRPAPAEGGLVKRAWFKYYRDLPELDEVVISVDCAFKETKDSDFVAIHVWGRKGANRYLLYRVHDRLDFIGTLAALRQVVAKYPGRAVLVEDKANGPAVISALRDEISGIIAVPVKDSKEARLVAVSPEIEAGNVHLPDASLAAAA